MQAKRITVWAVSIIVGLALSLAIVYLYIPLPFPAGYHIGFGTDITKYRIWFDGDLMVFQAIGIFGLVWIWLDYFLGTDMLPK
jgi:hypothetical protein